MQTLREVKVKAEVRFPCQHAIYMPVILSDVTTPLPVYHMENTERREGEYLARVL